MYHAVSTDTACADPPHSPSEDDMYEGMLIPEGALVFGDMDNPLRPRFHPGPDVFKPEWWLIARHGLRVRESGWFAKSDASVGLMRSITWQ